MALEPLEPVAEEPTNPELRDMTRRFRVSLVLAIPVLVLAMAEMVPGNPLGHRIPVHVSLWLQLLLSTPVVLWGGWPFFQRGWASIANRSPNMFTLIALGVGAAYVYSAAAALTPGLFPEGFRMHGVVETYFDTAVVITVLVLLGQVLDRFGFLDGCLDPSIRLVHERLQHGVQSLDWLQLIGDDELRRHEDAVASETGMRPEGDPVPLSRARMFCPAV